MNLNKLGLLAVTGAGVMAIAIAKSAADSPPAEAAPKKAAAKAGAATPATPAKPAAPAPAVAMPANPNAPPAVAAGPGGKAEVKELVFDAGNVERGTEIKHDFTIKNVGKYDLTVDAKPG